MMMMIKIPVTGPWQSFQIRNLVLKSILIWVTGYNLISDFKVQKETNVLIINKQMQKFWKTTDVRYYLNQSFSKQIWNWMTEKEENY